MNRRSYTIRQEILAANPVGAVESLTDLSRLDVRNAKPWLMAPDVSFDKASVTVEFTVLPDGTTENIVVVDPGASDGFDRVVVEALEATLYKPIPHAIRVTERVELTRNRQREQAPNNPLEDDG